MPHRLIRMCCVGATVTAALAVAAERVAMAQIGAIHMPEYDDAIMNCVDPDIIQAHLIADILADQALDAQLQLSMHLANRAEALRRAGDETDYIERLDAAIADDRARIAFLTENLACWRRRLADLIAGQDPDDKPGELVDAGDAPQPPLADPADIAEADRILAQLIAAAADFQAAMDDLDHALEAAGAADRVDDDNRAPSVGPTDDLPAAPQPPADGTEEATQARAAAADRLDAVSAQLTGGLYGAMSPGGSSESVPILIDPKPN